MDDEIIGQTPFTAEILEGKHMVRVKLAGHKLWQDDINVIANKNMDFSNIVLELAEMPRLEDGDFIFPKVRIIQGEPPAVGGAAALFIDVIGRPMSPGSVAGVHRRHRRREVARHTP